MALVIDSDGADPDVLDVLVYFQRSLGEPIDIDAPGRLVADGGANIAHNSP